MSQLKRNFIKYWLLIINYKSNYYYIMKFIYKVFLILGSLLAQVCSLPIIYEPHGPAIVVTQGKPIIYEPLEQTVGAIVPPPPPPAPPGPIDTNNIDDIMPAKFVLPDGNIIYTPKDIKPFIVPPFSDLEPIDK